MTSCAALEVDRPDVVADVLATVQRYEEALVANDIDALDAFMWQDARLVRVGVDDRQDGFASVSAFRRSQPRQTPPRMLQDTVVVTFDDHTAVVTTTFVPTDGAPAGRQSQTWVRTAAGWRIAAAHVSLPSSATRQAPDPNP